jgi:hypothetical protein
MKYSYVHPRRTDSKPTSLRPSHIVPDAVIAAREELATAIRTGSVSGIDKAADRLDSADRVARARRASAHAIRIVTRTLATPDFAWERLVSAVERFRK